MEDEDIISRCDVTSQKELEKHQKDGWEIEEIISASCTKMVRRSSQNTTVIFPKKLQ